jgi:putative nucleotidyltransferase with HDIG domain
MRELEVSIKKYEDVKILFIDDEFDNLESFALNFEDDFQILTEQDPKKGMQAALDTKELAVLLIDQVMPDMTGLEIVEMVKKQRPLLTCVMITGNATKELAIQAIKTRKIWDFIEKPINFGDRSTKQIIIGAIQEYCLNKLKVDYEQGTVELLARIIDERDGYTHEHSRRVMELSMKIASHFDISERDLVKLRQGALLHDVGKVGIPDNILKKPGRLSDLEREVIKAHPTKGARLLEKVPQLQEISFILESHHERPDGKGYPRGLKGEEIPLLAHIVHICDFFDALSSVRPYKKSWTTAEIAAEINYLKGKEFHPDVADAIYKVLVEENLITKEQLDEAMSGKVVSPEVKSGEVKR